ncbi:MAG: LysR family transcriptional regulator [Lachnospiraceae bacterium]|nr:LysR family transcriptional regulator [Lachnospiraceae bacterium]
MDVKDFEGFLTVCRYKNISRAASAMYISQQGLSKMIQRWERDFGVPLFRRTHTGIELTRFGRILEEHGQTIAAEYRATLADIQRETSVYDRIKVVIDLGVYSVLTPDVFFSFRKTYPHIDLIVQEHTEGTNRRLLDEEKADICIALAPSDEKFLFTPFYDVEGVVLLNRRNPLSEKEVICADDLRNERLIVLGSACNYAYVRACARAGFEPHLVISSVEMDDPFPYVNTDYGICLTFRGLVSEPGESSSVVLRPFVSDRLWSIGYLLKERQKVSRHLKLFIDHMVSFASNSKLL